MYDIVRYARGNNLFTDVTIKASSDFRPKEGKGFALSNFPWNRVQGNVPSYTKLFFRLSESES